MPSGRWVKDKESHGGRLTLHAFIGGEWAVTRNKKIQRGSAMGDPIGMDLVSAMEMAIASAESIAESEIPKQ